MVEAFAAQGSPKSFDVGILPGRLGSGFEGLDAHVFDALVKSFTEDGVTITQKVFWSGVKGKGVSDLLSGPGGCGGIGGVEMKDSAAVVGEDDEEEKDAEGGGGYGEEINGTDGFEMIFEESFPGLTGGTTFVRWRHVFGHGGLGDLDTELLELAVYAWGAPKWIGQRDFFDQGDDTGMDGRTALAFGFRKAAPVSAKGAAVPGNDGIGFEEKEGRAPFAPDAGEKDPELSVGIV